METPEIPNTVGELLQKIDIANTAAAKLDDDAPHDPTTCENCKKVAERKQALYSVIKADLARENIHPEDAITVLVGCVASILHAVARDLQPDPQVFDAILDDVDASLEKAVADGYYDGGTT